MLLLESPKHMEVQELGKDSKMDKKVCSDYFNKIHQKEVEINTAIKVINQLEGQFNQDQVLIDYYWELVQFYHQQNFKPLQIFTNIWINLTTRKKLLSSASSLS